MSAYNPFLVFKDSGQEIALLSAEWKGEGLVCRSEITPQLSVGNIDSFMFTHLTGTDLFEG